MVAANPSISMSPAASLPRRGCFTGRSRTVRLGRPDLVRFSLSIPGLKHELAMVIAMAVLGAILGLSIPMASGIIVDQVLPPADLRQLTIVCLFLVVMIVAATIFQAIQGLVVLRIEGRVSATLDSRILGSSAPAP